MRTKSQELMEEIRRFADSFFIENGRSPSSSEIACSVGIARGTAYKYLVAMNERGIICYNGKDIHTALTEKVKPSHSQAPICGRIPCGQPTEEVEQIKAIVSLPTVIFGYGELYILVASGDSMIGAGIEDGDFVVIKKQTTANDGNIVAALIDNESTLKYFYKDEKNNSIKLVAANAKYKDIVRPSCVIQGVAQHVIKRL